uniref:Uncharacterized protein n=1 Tax=Rhizophora mucronata TaxID=61149 RepID=A0A2P2PF94_RHIMU
MNLLGVTIFPGPHV